MPFIRNPLDDVTIASVSKHMWTGTGIIPIPTGTRTTSPPPPPVHPRLQITFKYVRLDQASMRALLLNERPSPRELEARRRETSGNPYQRAKVEATIKEWEKYAHVHFVHVDDNMDGDNDNDNDVTTQLRISFVLGGNDTFLGDTALIMNKGTTVYLGGVMGSDAVVTPMERHVILHEFGHVLGLHHEHQSPDRVGKLDPVAARCRNYMGFTSGTIKGQILDITPMDQVYNYSRLDLASVMMYPIGGDKNAQNIALTWNTELSNMDKAYMVINYPRRAGIAHEGPLDADWTMVRALTEVGLVDACPERQQILDLYGTLTAQDVTNIRRIFSEWALVKRAAERQAAIEVAKQAAKP